MEFKAVCTEDNQNAAGLHHVTLTDSNGLEIKFPSEKKCEKGETYTVTISGKGLDKPQPKPAAKPIDKFDAQPDKPNEPESRPAQ